MHITLSQNIVHLRKKHGLTQDKLSSVLGIKRCTLSSYEEYRSEPRLAVIQQMASVFKLSVQDMFSVDISQKELQDPFYFQLWE